MTYSSGQLEAARSRLIFACDVQTLAEAVEAGEMLKNSVGMWKIGLELFLREGRPVVERIAAFGLPIFLDLKLHDIPATVSRAILNLDQLPIRFLTIHASGGQEMLREAAAAAAKLSSRPTVLGVTVLTSLGGEDLARDGYSGTVGELVVARLRACLDAGVGGVVASALEVGTLAGLVPAGFSLVIPGIRPSSGVQDQKRVATPGAAIAAGATHLVVGRPIRDAADPAGAANDIVLEIARAAFGES
ncbi:orotidine-5'-phosphate decarboxylase [Myxococcota bacterium]|nr:orotidine-5'-phosphate decarboxylase [Myxococcota bacterium]MBU1510552.1 orotidine-5'-phosphate decarboxylase [Myxococcota bacterium]